MKLIEVIAKAVRVKSNIAFAEVEAGHGFEIGERIYTKWLNPGVPLEYSVAILSVEGDTICYPLTAPNGTLEGDGLICRSVVGYQMLLAELEQQRLEIRRELAELEGDEPPEQHLTVIADWFSEAEPLERIRLLLLELELREVIPRGCAITGPYSDRYCRCDRIQDSYGGWTLVQDARRPCPVHERGGPMR